uniref:Uncharacterized protein n=1 Tax=Anopheles quadriannulatus TaxID=34691 RepID=A0A182WRX8_ANOQN
MSSIREYKFFRSFSAKIENWHIRKAESLWKKMRERKIADTERRTAALSSDGGGKSSVALH